MFDSTNDQPMVLGIELSSEHRSICFSKILSEKIDIIEKMEWKESQRSSQLFEILNQYRDWLKQITLIGVGLGPGSFSSIRVSIAVALALKLTRNCPVMGICSADAVGKQLSHITRLGVFADARRQERYLTIYEKGKCLSGPKTVPNHDVKDEISKLTLAVSSEPLENILQRAYPQAETIAELAWEKFKRTGKGDDQLEAIYLREPVVNKDVKLVANEGNVLS